MARTIKITLPDGTTRINGRLISFTAPCDCNGITTLSVREYKETKYTEYSFVDAANIPVTNISGAFIANSVVSVVLVGNTAVIQNASYNSPTNISIKNNGGYVRGTIIASQVDPLIAGPNENMDGPYYVGSTDANYINLHKLHRTCHRGRYSYTNTQYVAYRLDHITRKAEVLCDLRSQASDEDHDGIIAVDENYIYFAKHRIYRPYYEEVETGEEIYDEETGEYYYPTEGLSPAMGGTILKFNHNGTLASSGPASGDQGWIYDLVNSINGEPTYDTVMPHHYSTIDTDTVYQTKNFIIIYYTGVKSTSGYVYHMSIISKEQLKIMSSGTGFNGGVSRIFSNVYREDNPTICPIYSADAIYCSKNTNANGMEFCTLNTTTTNGYTTTNNTSIKFNNVSYYIESISPGGIYRDNTHNYYHIVMKHQSQSLYGETIITEDDINITSGIATAKYYASGNNLKYIQHDILLQCHDPITDDFNYYGGKYTIYPALTEPSNISEINNGFEFQGGRTPSKVNNYFYLRRKYDGLVFKVKNEPQYLLDRVEAANESN